MKVKRGRKNVRGGKEEELQGENRIIVREKEGTFTTWQGHPKSKLRETGKWRVRKQ